MGYWGKRYYGKLTMQEVREMIEEDTGMTVTSLNFKYAVCVTDDKAIAKHEHWRKNFKVSPKNYIMIALWYKSQGQIMIKQVSEDMGPCEIDVPMKYINAECELMKGNKFSTEWRECVRKFHKKRKAKLKLMNSMKNGDRFFCYGQSYRFNYKKNSNWCIANNLNENGKSYRLRPGQISMKRS